MTGKPVRQWLCTVCGHRQVGLEPPACCALCGAGPERFEHPTESPEAVPGVSDRWRCLICETVHEGVRPPQRCPVCGASADQLEASGGGSAPCQSPTGRLRVVVAGGGIAAVSAATAVRQTLPSADVTLLCKEPVVPYYRLNLTRVLAGEIAEEKLPLHPEGWYRQQRIDLRLGTEVNRIDRAEHHVILADGVRLPYDKLILAVGAHPYVPPVAGMQREGVHTLRTLADVPRLRAQLTPKARVVILGGGLLGLETAGALVDRVAHVTVLEGAAWLLPRQLTPAAGEVLQTFVRGRGIQLRLRARVREILGDERVSGVLLDDDDVIPADGVIVSAGVRPNSYLARLAGLEVHQGIVVDTRMRTSDPDVYAAGDVAEYQGLVYGLWGPALQQGRVAGRQAAGGEGRFASRPASSVLKVLGIDLFSVGRFTARDASDEVIEATTGSCAQSFCFHDGALVGAVLLGDTRASAWVKQAIEREIDCLPWLQGPRRVDTLADFLQRQLAVRR